MEILGIDTSCGNYPGIVLEYCSQGNFVSVSDTYPFRFCLLICRNKLKYKHKMRQDEELYITYVSLGYIDFILMYLTSD